MDCLWTDSSYISLNKYGEELCGDQVAIMRDDPTQTTTLVLADGLGSGVKANILSTLTSKILCTMIMNGLSVDDCVETMASTLPVCQVRQVAYSTFSILRVLGENEAELIQYDNPQTILLRDGKNYDYPVHKRTIDDKLIMESHVPLQLGDALIAMSDGAIYAGVGSKFNFGWQRDNIIEYMQQHYKPEYSAHQLANLLSQACNDLYGGKPGDDTTIAVIKMCRRHSVSLVIGPPKDKEDDKIMMEQFFAGDSVKIVCGGTTAQIAARYLGERLCCELRYLDKDIPPVSHVPGVDLVTEGVVTMSKVLEYALACAKDIGNYQLRCFEKQDAASLIARELIEKATDIRFFVGRAINAAHQDPDLPINFSIKLSLIKELSKALTVLGKKVQISYY